MLRSILVFVFVLAVTVVLGVAAHSLFVMHAWTMAAAQATGAVPPSLSLPEHLNWIGHEIVDMGLLSATLAITPLLFSFIAAVLLARIPRLRPPPFPLPPSRPLPL